MLRGMTVKEYWDGDAELVVFYRQADELRQERQNEAAWLQGLYIRDAVSAVLLGEKKAPYPKEPVSLNTEVSRKKRELQQIQNERKVTDYFMTFATQFNKRFKEKQAKEKGVT